MKCKRCERKFEFPEYVEYKLDYYSAVALMNYNSKDVGTWTMMPVASRVPSCPWCHLPLYQEIHISGERVNE